MGEVFITRRGGSLNSLKSPVINVGNLADLPTSSEEGTVAIISAIPGQQIFISEEQPSSTTLGDLWFYPAVSGKINYNKNGQNYVIGTIYQYDGTRWMMVPATQYRNGEWLSTVVYLLDGVDHGEEYTGGWGKYSANSGSVELLETGFKLVSANDSHQPAGIQTMNKIDLTNYNRIIFKGEISTVSYDSNWHPRFGIQELQAEGYKASNSDGFKKLHNGVAYIQYNTKGNYEVTLPIDSYKAAYYVGVSGGAKMTVTQVRLEV